MHRELAPRALPATLLLALALRVAAQEPTGPALLVAPDDAADGAPREALAIREARVEARVAGGLAETAMTLTFANPHDRNLAGDLFFPLPEGATISGYALDIQGVMVDGVVVERQQAREVYERVVRRGIDPGLVEWTRGNHFTTRVFPIPPHGTRTVTVTYVADLTGAGPELAYRLPLHFSAPLERFRLRVEVANQRVAPAVREGGLANFAFAEWRKGYVGDVTLTNVAPARDLVVALPGLDPAQPAVALETAPDGDTYFCVHDAPPAIRTEPRVTPTRIGVLWDASGSRAGADHGRAIRLLAAHLTGLRQPALTVDLVVFRHVPEPTRTFTIRNGDAAELCDALHAIAYDGGTRLATLTAALAAGPLPDYYLAFTDGMATLGNEPLATPPRPLFVLCPDAFANHALLAHVAEASGGALLNLAALADAEALPRIGEPPLCLLGISADPPDAVTDLQPAAARPAQGRAPVAGKLRGPRATLTLRYGIAGQVLHTATCTLDAADATPGTLASRAWAQLALRPLELDPARNAKAIGALGRAHGLVTPATSLLVLDNPALYIEHHIAPPATMPAWRDAYFAAISQQKQDKDQQRADKLTAVLALWTNRVAWWNREFKVPPDFKYHEEPGDGGAMPSAGEAGEALGAGEVVHRGIFGGRDASAPAAAAPRSPPAMAMLDVAPAEAVPPPEPAPQPPVTTVAGAPAWADGSTRAPARDTDGEAPAADAAETGVTPQRPAPAPAIALEAWDPDTPYLKALRAATPARRLSTYLEQRHRHGTTPGFFMDGADFFQKAGDPALALRAAGNLAELELENPALLRALGYVLTRLNEFDLAVLVFEDVLRLRPEEPQSYRDLALALARRAERAATPAQRQADLARAIDMLYQVVMKDWERFDEVELIALLELNRLVPLARAVGVTDLAVDPRLLKTLDLDARIVLTWDADMTDIDLWVTEPSGEKASYQHQDTTIGGKVSRDFTQGYGPEEYLLRRALPGTYKIEANYYGRSAPKLLGPVTLQLELFTGYARTNEQRRVVTLRLGAAKDSVKVAEFEF